MSWDGFIDLRLNSRSGGAEDSFWPSFADIMSVIVMIFMLAMVILLVRNMDLVQKLRVTMEAERHAAELARSSSLEKDVLSSLLTETESELSMLRLKMMQLRETNEELNTRLERRETELQRLQTDRAQLVSERDRLSATMQELNQNLAQQQQQYQRLRSEHRDVSTRYQELQAQTQFTEQALEEAQRASQEQLMALQELREQIRRTEQTLSKEREHYSQLKTKYDELVRPARSPAGKFVVEVRYSKEGGQERIELTRPSDKTPQRVARNELHRRLNALKRQHPDSLYIKIIFPEDSGLSYNEAWTFTSELLKRYDYYYQSAP